MGLHNVFLLVGQFTSILLTLLSSDSAKLHINMMLNSPVIC